MSSLPSTDHPNLSQPILKASDHHSDQKHHRLLAATGSVATIKIPLILHALSHHPALSIRLIFSESARQFLQGQSAEQPTIASLLQITNVDGIYFDEHEWTKPWVRGDSILHIELRRWADLMVVAPLSANGLAKISQGMSGDLVSSVIRAWDFSGLIDGARPGVALPYDMGKTKEELGGLPEAFREGRKKGIIVAPAMNTAMWSHPVTAKQLKVLEEEWGVGNGGWFEVLRPVEKMLACGDTGSGAMRDWKGIVGVIEERLCLGHDADGGVKKNDVV
jgi:phosphopantothenoylcysteine decarboxylase